MTTSYLVTLTSDFVPDWNPWDFTLVPASAGSPPYQVSVLRVIDDVEPKAAVIQFNVVDANGHQTAKTAVVILDQLQQHTQAPDIQGILRVTVPWEVLQDHTIPVGTIITILSIAGPEATVEWMDNCDSPLQVIVFLEDLESHTEAA